MDRLFTRSVFFEFLDSFDSLLFRPGGASAQESFFSSSTICMPARLPKTTKSSSELQPSRLAPCSERQEHSPAAYSPGTGIIVNVRYLAVYISGYSSHHIMACRVDGNQVGCRVQPEVDLYERRYIGKSFGKFFLTEMGEVEMDVILSIYTPALANFRVNRAGYHIPRRQIFNRRSIPFHEAFSDAVAEHPALASCRFADKNPKPENSRWMELDEFHVFEGKPSLVG